MEFLHSKYFCNGDCPEDVEEEFEKWHGKLESAIERLDRIGEMKSEAK